jgi:putative SOS response-associated peptidase YedK
MCSHYKGVNDPKRFAKAFGIVMPEAQGMKSDLWPGYSGSFIRRPEHAGVGDEAVPESEALAGMFGLVPHWSTDIKIARSTYNARSETVATKPSFRDAWKNAQHCIIPADAIYEPDWRSGKAVATRIERADGEPIGIAGLWASWKSAKGELLHSYTMLTINADGHELMSNFHKSTDEKRMVVILNEDAYAGWLGATSKSSMEFMRPYPTEKLGIGAPQIDGNHTEKSSS